MGFSFRLESVLKYRQRIVDRQGRQVAEAQRRVAEIQTRIHSLQEEISRGIRAPVTGPDGGIRMQDLMAKTAWLEHLADRRDALDGSLDEARRELALRQADLQEAWRDLEVLDRLRGRRQEQWEEEQRRREAKELDEIGQIRADQERRSILARTREQLS